MDFELPGHDDPRRMQIREWLAAHPQPSGQELAEAGWVAPHWPEPWGVGADPVFQLIIDEELKSAGVSIPRNQIGIGWAGPTLIHAGSEEQKQRYLPKLLSGEEIWCQLFSEPDAGSDLANLKTTARWTGDHWVVSGQKVWTSLAHESAYGILIARTEPDAPKHQGISYFVCPMDLPGIEIRPIIDMSGAHSFNEVFLNDVKLPAESLVGERGQGWALAKVTLGNERVSLSSGGALWGLGPSAMDLIDLIRSRGGLSDSGLRQQAAALYIESEILRLIRLRTVSALAQGKQPGPEASIRKAMADEHGQKVMALAVACMGTDSLLSDGQLLGTDGNFWQYGWSFAPALTIGGGTAQVQRNIIGERILGLPTEASTARR
ncbi:MAG: acyl-CoA dehydrogenase family protein [Acidimicrobiia bacterium]|nr:acyl-CoA dehydrogenase family protein [Acidimicrobiia bacterium]